MTDLSQRDDLLKRLKPEAATRLRQLLDNGKLLLATVPYDPTTPKEIRQVIERDFNISVQPAFLKYLAKEYRNELTRVGIDAHGIDCMASGMLPYDKDGRAYPVNIDHIADRSGAGSSAEGINTFDNLVLIHIPLHSLKTSFTHAQTRKLTEPSTILALRPAAGSGAQAKILVPDDVTLHAEELGRGTWLYRASAASERYQYAAQRLEDTPDNSDTYADLTIEMLQAREAEARIWQWAGEAHRQKDPSGFDALLNHDATAPPQQETAAFFKAWQEYMPYLDVRRGHGELKTSLQLNTDEISLLKTVTGFSLINYANFDTVALDTPYNDINTLNNKLTTLTERQVVNFTPADIATLAHLLGQVGQYISVIPKDVFPVTRDELEHLEDKLTAADPLTAAAVPSPSTIALVIR